MKGGGGGDSVEGRGRVAVGNYAHIIMHNPHSNANSITHIKIQSNAKVCIRRNANKLSMATKLLLGSHLKKNAYSTLKRGTVLADKYAIY